MAQVLRLPEAPPYPCRVCGCNPVRVDVADAGVDLGGLLLAECPRCDHRWTEVLRERRQVIAARPVRRAVREGASAA
jgi:hypothetical protein